MEKKRETYFSTENFNLLHDVLKNDIQSKFNFDINNSDVDFRKLLFQQMSTSFEKEKKNNLKKINMATIRQTAPLLYNILQNNKNEPTYNREYTQEINDFSSNIRQRNQLNKNTLKKKLQTYPNTDKRDIALPIRDITLNRQMPEYTNLRPEYNMKQENSTITNQFEQMNNERMQDPIKMNEKVDFTLPQTVNGRSSMELFEQLSMQRKKEEKETEKKLKSHQEQQFKQQMNSMNEFDKNMNEKIQQNEQIMENNIVLNNEINETFTNNQYYENENENKNGNGNNNYMNEYNSNDNYINENENDNNISQSDDNIINNIISASVGNNEDNDPHWSWDKQDNDKLTDIEKRLQLDNEMRNKNNLADPTIIYKTEQQQMNDIIKEEEQIYGQQSNIIKTVDVSEQRKLETRKKTHFIEIDSGSRALDNMINNANRYSFKISFSPAMNQMKKVPLFENNPTIPATEEQIQNGQRGDLNVDGWTARDGTAYDVYDASIPYGGIVDYEEILYSGTNNLYIKDIFKNIVEIKLSQLLIPIEYIAHPADQSPTNLMVIPCLKENYLLLHIEELDGVYDSTSEIIQKSFAKLTRFDNNNTTLTYPTNRNNNDNFKYLGSLSFCVANKNVSKTFYPSPLSSLTSMTMRILKPNGEPLSLQKDSASIRAIKYETPTDWTNILENRHIVIKLDTYVSRLIFTIYSNIVIKGYDIPINNTLCPSVNEFEKFINSPNGHTIVHVDSDDTDASNFGYVNKIYIASKGSFNIKTGIYEVHDFGNEQLFNNLTATLSAVYLQNEDFDLDDDISPFGTVINTTFQSSMSFEITTLEGNFEAFNTGVKLI